ncbi:MAG TPA: hypothetical protein ENJ31_13930 [Anaerolineae bacterium]|nr:hypothetical protein [Anaerolineae bacterium]
MQKQRPFAVILLTIIAVLAGISAVLDVLRYLGLLPITIPFFGAHLSFFGFSFFGAILSGIVAVIWFWVASRLWNLESQGWLFVVVISVVNIIFQVVALLGGTPLSALWLSLGLPIFTLILGLLPGTKAAFGQR